MTYDDYVKKLDQLKRTAPNGSDCWRARDVQTLLGYTEWRAFEDVVTKAIEAFRQTGSDPSHHFVHAARMVGLGSGAQRETDDWILSRGACYVLAMNGDSRKPEVGFAQLYFAIQTRRQEQFDALVDAQRRIVLRERVKEANTALNDAAAEVGVQRFGAFHSAGYRGQYGERTVDEIKAHKGIPPNEKLLDCIGRAELAMNEFRITQTEQVIRERVNSESEAIDAHYKVGKQVREAVGRISGTMPEDLPREVPIKTLEEAITREPSLLDGDDDGKK